MTKQALKRTVGFCAAAWQASTSRWVDGVLRYVTATPGLAFRDFSFQQDMRTDELAPAPSWLGKADGMILAFGLREGDPADAVMRWIERGRQLVRAHIQTSLNDLEFAEGASKFSSPKFADL